MIQEYRIAKGWRIIMFILLSLIIFFFAQIGLSSLKNKTPDPINNIVSFVSVAVLAFCIWRLMTLVKEKILVSDISITQVTALTTRELPYKMAKGYIMRKGTIIILPEEKGYPRIRVNPRTENMQQLRTELGRHISDLDELNLKQHEERLLNDEELGATREERKETLKETNRYAQNLSLAGLISLLWLFLYPHPYMLAIAVALLIPLAVLFAKNRHKALMSVRDTRRKAFPIALVALMLPTIGLLYRVFSDYHLLEYSRIWLPAAVLTLVLTAIITIRLNVSGVPEYKGTSIFTYVLFCMAAYSYSACVLGNCLLDSSSSRHYTAAVVDKWKSHRKKHTSYHLKLAPWGPQKQVKEVSVPKDLYNGINKGETVNLHLKQGALHIPWFEVSK